MTAKQKLESQEKKIQIYNARIATCEVCGKNIPFNDCQLAHRIPKTKMYLKKYGVEIIHHEMNLALVCGLRCNSAVNIGMNPIAVGELVNKIRQNIAESG